MPVAPSGLDCDMLSRFVRSYTGALLSGTDICAVAFIDESFSTLQAADQVMQTAKRTVKRSPSRMKRAIDSNAASVILQEALDLLQQNDRSCSEPVQD
jgi:RNase H-fold protein (predicted Holliday junction resolvase)